MIPAILQSASNGYLMGQGGYRPKDICVSAPTGSGKTLSFVIPIIQVSLPPAKHRANVLLEQNQPHPELKSRLESQGICGCKSTDFLLRAV